MPERGKSQSDSGDTVAWFKRGIVSRSQALSVAIWPRASHGAGLQGIGLGTILSVREKLVDLLKELAEPAWV